MRSFFVCLFLVFGLITAPFSLQAEDSDDTAQESWIDDDHPVVVELFTSSNCTACMEADRLLYDISKKKNIIALGCHTDIWDSETLNNPTGLEECTYRQWAYRASGRMVNTKIRVPHLIINGHHSIGSGSLSFFHNALGLVKHGTAHKPLFIGMEWKDDDTITIELPDRDFEINENRDSFSVWLVRYQDYLIKKIDTGHTAGRVLRFSNVVRDADHIAKWHGKKRVIEIDVPKPPGGKERGGYVTIIHKVNGSQILAAGKLVDYRPKRKKAAAQE